MPPLPILHHVTYSVTDLQRSAAFYQRLFGPCDVADRHGEGWARIVLRWPDGLMIAVTRHHATTAAETFDPVRVGIDHIGFGCGSEQEVRDWAARFDELGVPHGPVEQTPQAVVVTGRDPDNIPVEFYWRRG